MGLLESWGAMNLEGKPKDMIIIGVEPKETGWGLQLSPELEGRVFEIIEMVLEECKDEPN